MVNIKGGGVTELNRLSGAVTLSEGSGIFFDTTGNDIAINAIGSTVPSDTSLAVKVATTAALPGTPTYDNGTAGVGATLTRSSNGTTGTIDGVTAANLMAGDYILVKNQAAQLQNGVYEVTQQGTASLPYILTRVTEADTTAELDDLVVTAALGSTNKGVPYGQQTNNPTIGVSNIVFTATGIYMRQASSGTQAINQIPVYTGTALTQTKGTANFKYNPTNDLFTIRGIDYTFPANNGDASQVLTTDGSGTLSWTTPNGGGTPAGSNNQIQINQSSAFFADSTFQKSDTDFNVGLDHTQQSAVSFTGSGLDDLIVAGTFSGTVPTTYTVTIDGVNVDFLVMDTGSITGGSFAVSDVVTNGTGGTATILSISVDGSNTYLGVNITAGSFSAFDVIDNGSGVTATIGTPEVNDTYTLTDGITTLNDVPALTNPNSTLNGIKTAFGASTGHTLTESWTWDYTSVNQNVLDFSNNDYKFQSTFGTDTFGYQIGDNLLGYGLKGSVNTWVNGSDLVLSGTYLQGTTLTSGTTIQIGSASAASLLEIDKSYASISDGTDSGNYNLRVNQLGLSNTIGGIDYGIEQSAGVVTIGNTNGGNNTKITIDDVTQLITVSNVPTYADDAAAATGGLTTGQLYKTTTLGTTSLNIVP